MTGDNTTAPAPMGDDLQDVTIEVELTGQRAQREIDNAVTGRRRLARKYVLGLRRSG